VIAVLDTGVLPHPELGGRLLPGYDFISYTFTANDGDGRDSDARDPGNWISAAEADTGACVGQAAQDSDWHGTQIAGIAAAQGNNASAIAGINWNTRILPVRVLGKCGGYDSDILDAIRWAAGLPVSGVPANPTPADVLNLSFGAPGACSAAYAAVFREVRATGASVVVSTGNEAAYEVLSPANCPNVIAVTGHAIDGTSYLYANVGPEVALSAPAGGYATDPDGMGGGSGAPLTVLFNSGTTSPTASWTLALWEGTSLAAAHVSGTLALVRGLLPDADPDQMKSLLTDNVRPFPAGSWCALADRPQSGRCGAGLLDVGKVMTAVQALVPANQAPVALPLGVQAGRAGQALDLYLTASDANGDALTWTAVTLPAGATLGADGHFHWGSPAAGLHELVYTVGDGSAKTGPVTVVLDVRAASAATGGGILSPGMLVILAIAGLRRRR
jgi:serine protease